MLDLMGGEVTLSEKEAETGDGAPVDEVPRKNDDMSTFGLLIGVALVIVLDVEVAFVVVDVDVDSFPFVVTAVLDGGAVASIEPNDCTVRGSAFTLEGGVSFAGEAIGADFSLTVPKLSEPPVRKVRRTIENEIIKA